jgi:hypothetical protein
MPSSAVQAKRAANAVGSLAYLLKNRFYIGEITYSGRGASR